MQSLTDSLADVQLRRFRPSGKPQPVEIDGDSDCYAPNAAESDEETRGTYTDSTVAKKLAKQQSKQQALMEDPESPIDNAFATDVDQQAMYMAGRQAHSRVMDKWLPPSVLALQKQLAPVVRVWWMRQPSMQEEDAVKAVNQKIEALRFIRSLRGDNAKSVFLFHPQEWISTIDMTKEHVREIEREGNRRKREKLIEGLVKQTRILISLARHSGMDYSMTVPEDWSRKTYRLLRSIPKTEGVRRGMTQPSYQQVSETKPIIDSILSLWLRDPEDERGSMAKILAQVAALDQEGRFDPVFYNKPVDAEMSRLEYGLRISSAAKRGEHFSQSLPRFVAILAASGCIIPPRVKVPELSEALEQRVCEMIFCDTENEGSV